MMKKLTLQFDSLTQLTRFSKTVIGGYVLNTSNLTLTAKLPEMQVGLALDLYHAVVLQTTGSYCDPITIYVSHLPTEE